MAAILPIYFRNVAAVVLSEADRSVATAIWGYTTAAAMLLVAFLSLTLGPYSDAAGKKKPFLGLFILLGTLSTMALTCTGAGDWLWVALLFICGNIGFAGGEVFYDALLPHLAPREELDRISTRAYAMGYIGGGILLAINIGMIFWLPKTTLVSGGAPVPLLGMQLSFLSVGLWWGAFSIPLFRHIPEPVPTRPPPVTKNAEIQSMQDLQAGQDPVSFRTHGNTRVWTDNPPSSLLNTSLTRLSSTFHEIRSYKSVFLFLLAFWFYNDGIGTIIKMATIFGSEIGIGTLDLIGALLLTQFVGIPCSFGFGRLAARIGAKRGILLGIGVYLVITVCAYFMTNAVHFWILAAAVGVVQGGTQGLSRSYYAAIIPKEKSAEFFSFYNISGKFAGVLGPAIFAFTTQLFQNSRLGILSLVVFFILGGWLLIRVPEGREETHA